jgi:plastocyanin
MRRTLTAIVALVSLLLLLAAVPAVVRAGGGCHVPGPGATYTEGPATVVRMDVCSFAPTIARVPVGTEVRFLNTSSGAHIVLGRNGTWVSETLEPGAEYSERFTTEGTYPFECPLHPGMVGAIVVGDGALDGAPGGGTAPAAVVTSPAPSPASASTAPVKPASPASDTTDMTWAPIAIAAFAGLAIGALVTSLLGAAVTDRLRARSATGH